MKNWVLITLFGVFFQQAGAETLCRQYVGTCGYYSCLSETLNCSETNYIHSFGDKYCKKFDIRKSKFSTTGKKFLNSVQNCLQIKLEEDSKKLTCETSKSLAAVHHVQCYRDNKFCNLKTTDQFWIVQTVLKPVLTDPVFQKVGHDIIADCQK